MRIQIRPSNSPYLESKLGLATSKYTSPEYIKIIEPSNFQPNAQQFPSKTARCRMLVRIGPVVLRNTEGVKCLVGRPWKWEVKLHLFLVPPGFNEVYGSSLDTTYYAGIAFSPSLRNENTVVFRE